MSDNTKLDAILEQDEKILWSGVAQPYSLFDESQKKSTMVTLGWALAWAIVLVGGYAAVAITQNVEIKTGVMVFCLCVPLLIIGMTVADKDKVKKLSYVVTNKRAIVLSDKPIFLRTDDIDDIRVDTADNGNCHIRVGAATFKTSPRKLPFLAHRGVLSGQDSGKPYTGLVFYNVRGKDEKIVSPLLKGEASAAHA